MGTGRLCHRGGTAVVLVNNEIVLNPVRRVLERRGFEVRRDIESCGMADVGFVGSYFALLGILNHIRMLNASLPLVLIISREHELGGQLEAFRGIYDVIKLDEYSEAEIGQKVSRWFTKEPARRLVGGGSDANGHRNF
mgnify:CR=1 FL=1